MSAWLAARLESVSPLDCAGPNACRIVFLYTWVFWIAMFVLVVVGGLIVYAALRFRRRDEQEPAQVHGNGRLEIVWTAAPFAILLFLFILTAANMGYINRGPSPQMTIDVVGQQFAWTYTYPDAKVRSDTLRIPTGEVIRLRVTSRDVLHAFWAPRLAGQIYAVPGHVNEGWLQADQPGTYLGQCNELCGIGHQLMSVKVIAMKPADFEKWYAEERAKAGG